MAVEKECKVFGKDKASLSRLYDRLKAWGQGSSRNFDDIGQHAPYSCGVAQFGVLDITLERIDALSLIILQIIPRMNSDARIFWTM